MLLSTGQAGIETVITEEEKYLNKQERAEYDRLHAECLKEGREIIKNAVEAGESWRETSLKISEVNRKRTTQMLSILESAMQREQEKQQG